MLPRSAPTRSSAAAVAAGSKRRPDCDNCSLSHLWASDLRVGGVTSSARPPAAFTAAASALGTAGRRPPMTGSTPRSHTSTRSVVAGMLSSRRTSSSCSPERANRARWRPTTTRREVRNGSVWAASTSGARRHPPSGSLKLASSSCSRARLRSSSPSVSLTILVTVSATRTGSSPVTNWTLTGALGPMSAQCERAATTP